MGRIAQETEYIKLDKQEQELIEYASEGDWFFAEGWAKYGEDWPAYVPDNINVAMGYFFQMQLLPKQLVAYYCPIYDVMIHGGRYSGKTDALACAGAMWLALHPGNDWLHVSPSLEQAAISYHAILTRGSAGAFAKTFIRHYREAPAPTLFFKPWNKFDPGSEAQFRSIGQNPMELLRSFEAGRVTADEAFRTQTSDGAYRVLAGMVRGPNKYMLNAQPELKETYDNLAFEVASEQNHVRMKKLQVEMDGFAQKYGLSKDIRFMLYGNVGAYTWEWNRFNWGLRNPSKRYCVTWTSDDNPYVTERQRELLRQQHINDPDGLRVEMMATRPIAVGDVFIGEHMSNMFDGDLDAEALKAIDEEQKGWAWQMHEDYGLLEYGKPADKRAAYIVGGDPGTGRVPARNKWVNLVWKISERPFELVYMKTGNLGRRGQGSIEPWIMNAKRILRTYPVAEGHYAAEAGGPQKNVHEVVWPDDLRIVPLNMNMQKAQLIMQAQLMLRRNMFISPNIALLEQEMLSYQLQDKKLAQDFVMAFLASVYVIWPYVADEFELYEEQTEDDGWWDFEEVGREIRLYGREIRSR